MEELFEIPSSWKWTNIEGIGETFSGGTPKTADESNFDGDIPWITPADLTGYTARYISRGKRNITEKGLENSSAKIMPEGTVLFSSRAPIGYVAISKNPVCTNQGFKCIKPSLNINSEYVYYYLKSSKSIVESRASGTTFLEISGSRFNNIPIPIAPLNEQKRIVDKIEQLFSNLDEGESLLKKVQQQLNVYRQSVLKAAVTGELTKDWREANKDRLEPGDVLLRRILKARREQWNGRGKFKEPFAPDTSNLPELPDGWVWCTLDHIISDGPQNGVYYPKNLYGKGIKILRIDDYQVGWIKSYDQLQKVDSPAKDRNLYRLKLGDIVVNRVNSVSHLGKSLCIGKSHEGCIFESNMMRFSLSNTVNNKFYELYLGSAIGRARLISNCKHAVNQASINQQDVKQTVAPLLSLLEQDEIVNKINDAFSQIDALEQWCASELTRSATLRQSILKDAFSGKLVPQDPDDEPASELLKRIQAEKSGLQKAPKGKSSSTTPTRRGRPRQNKLS